MTEQAGYLNAPDLVEECARAMREGEIERTPSSLKYRVMPWDDMEAVFQEPYYDLVNYVISVLRKRGLLTIQALEMLEDK